MSLLSRSAGLLGGVIDKLYVDDVFSAFTYQGNGATQTINNGIDLAGKGGMVWQKSRNTVSSYTHRLTDTLRGAGNTLRPDATDPQNLTGIGISAFLSSGFSLPSDDGSSSAEQNRATDKYISWTFRRAKEFFDVVSYTGNGVAGRQIPHALGIAPGMVIVKATSTSGSWFVYHNGIGPTKFLNLDSTNAAGINSSPWANTDPTSTEFTTGLNNSGVTYIAYLFAHSPSADGIIQCGSAVVNSNGALSAALGFEAQFVMLKKVNGAENWITMDTARNMSLANAEMISPNTYGAAITTNTAFSPTATGFSSGNGFFVTGETYIYLAIRRSNKIPTSGTQVYNAIARTGTGAAATVTGVGFAPDLVISQNKVNGFPSIWLDRLRGATKGIAASFTAAEYTQADTLTSFEMDGFKAGADTSQLWINSTLAGAGVYINHFFRRAPGFFDEVCYTGTGAARTEAHGLKAVPELMILKSRSDVQAWNVYHKDIGVTTSKILVLNLTTAAQNGDTWDSTFPTATVFSHGAGAGGVSGQTYVAYLFASLPGISKVSSFTGNGSSQTIPCGFANGARFILIKRTDSTGDWYVWDTVRGIIAANDPHLSLNTTAAEVTTDDSVDPDPSGFIVNQNAATNINVSGGTYIYLAIA